ncbi:MAG: hypothetical protein KDE20_12765, partial [Caldilineaceae bacterium]|nr:hypothetical protein [Caldilineaceae bacterium]
LDGQFMGYEAAMESVKKAHDLVDQLSWLIARKSRDNALRQKCGLFVDWDYSAGYERALTDIMEKVLA